MTKNITRDDIAESINQEFGLTKKDCNELVKDIIEDQAVDYLAEHLTTPLQVEQHLTLALEEAYAVGVKPINVDLLEETLSSRIDEIEPTLIRHGYNERVIADQFRYKPADVRKLFKGDLDPTRAKEMTAEMREAGLPI